MIKIILFLCLFQPIDVMEYDLDNGLKVLIYEDHFAPVVSTQIHYGVGSYNEPRGLTGISHLLEHMAFRGTKKYGPKEYDRIIEESGGYENGFTSIHETVFYANLRSDRYELELELEADRMNNLLIAQSEFVPEKAVVMEERRLGENDPYEYLFENLDLVSFTNSPYRQPIIGFMSDIERITRDEVYQWYRKYYNPAQAVIVLAGDVDPTQALNSIKRCFGKIKGTPAEPSPSIFEPPQVGERRFELKREVNSPALMIHYHTVPIKDQAMFVLDVIAMILSAGSSARFERNLVQEKGVATEVKVYHYNYRYGGNFYIQGIPQTGVSIATLEKELLAEIDRLKTEAVTDAELEKAKNRALAQVIYRQDAPDDMGFEIAFWAMESGDWHNINRYPLEIQKVTKEDIIEAARRYFDKDNRTIGFLVPGEER